MKMSYERVDVKKLKFDKRNARKHDKKNIKAIKDSLVKFGQQKPIVVMEDGTVIAGNGTLQAAIELGWDTIDVHWTALKKDEAIAYGLVDNRSAELAEWDDDNLKELLSELDASGWDLEGLGWDSEDLKDIIDQKPVEGLTDEDEVPETKQNEFNVQLGDIWQLGEHRLMCGDSTDKATVEKLMNGEKADMVFTDPPYKLETEGGTKSAIGKDLGKQGKSINFISDFDPKDFLAVLPNVFSKGMNAYVFCNKELLPDYLIWARDFGYSFNVLIWKKPNAIPIRDSHRPDIEYLILFRKSAIWNYGIDGVNYSRCLEYGRESGLHPTMKPVELISNEILISSNSKNIVVDCFCGSGSTLIACEKTGRKCYGMELDPHYCSVIIKRWQDFTGKQAVKL